MARDMGAWLALAASAWLVPAAGTWLAPTWGAWLVATSCWLATATGGGILISTTREDAPACAMGPSKPSIWLHVSGPAAYTTASKMAMF